MRQSDFAWLLIVAGCSTHRWDTRAGVPRLVPGPDDPKSCINAPVAKLATEPRDPWRDEVEARVASVKACQRTLESPGWVMVSVRGAPGEKTEARVIESSLEDCAVVACVKEALEGAPSPAESKKIGLRLILDPRTSPTIANGGGSSTPNATRCVDPRSLEVETAHAEGGLPPERIQAIVRASYGDFRSCYEDGLGRDPHLTGKVVTGFVIGLDGRVSTAVTTDNTLPDCAVVSCIRARFMRMVFPEIVSKPISVVYPILLEPAPPAEHARSTVR